jgi:hypothetical protein
MKENLNKYLFIDKTNFNSTHEKVFQSLKIEKKKIHL